MTSRPLSLAFSKATLSSSSSWHWNFQLHRWKFRFGSGATRCFRCRRLPRRWKNRSHRRPRRKRRRICPNRPWPINEGRKDPIQKFGETKSISVNISFLDGMLLLFQNHQRRTAGQCCLLGSRERRKVSIPKFNGIVPMTKIKFSLTTMRPGLVCDADEVHIGSPLS